VVRVGQRRERGGPARLRIDALKPINKHMPELGLAFALAQAAIDFAEGKKKRGVLNLVKSVANYGAGKLVDTRAMNIAFVGVFLLDYSLDKFAQAALSQRYDLYVRAYQLHYKETHPRNHTTLWVQRLRKIIRTTKHADQLGARIRKAMVEDVEAFWRDATVVAKYKDRVMKRHRFTGFGGLNRAVERKISQNQLRALRQRLTSALNRLAREVRMKHQARAYELLRRARSGINQVHTIKVVVKGPEPAAGSKAAPPKLEGLQVRVPVRDARQRDKWKGVTDAKGVFELRCTTLGYLVAGLPRRVELTLPPKEPDAKPRRLTAKLKLKPHGKLTLVTFDLGEPKLEGRWRVTQTITNMNVNGRWIRGGVGARSTIELDFSQRWKVQKTGKWYFLQSPKVFGGSTTYRIRFTGPRSFVGKTSSGRDRGRRKLFVMSTVVGTRID
jgi:hypothetical protein